MNMNKTCLIDLDGTMYCGDTLIPGAKIFIDWMLAQGHAFLFLTNNATRTRAENAAHMEKLGYRGILPSHFFTSAMASAAYVAKRSDRRRAYYIGMAGLEEALLEQGFELVKEQADFVFVGLDKTADYRRYSDALKQLLDGARLIGTNTDRLIATSQGFDIGNGSIMNMFEYASSQTSPRIGKPYAPILELALDKLQLAKEDVVVIGDNLETDIRLGFDHGVETVFVTSGVHQREDIARLGVYPDHVVDDLRELIGADGEICLPK